MKKLACCLLLGAFGARAAEPPPPPPATEFAQLNQRKVRLHLLTDDQRVQLTDSSGRVVCKAPCNAEVPVLQGDVFRLTGAGLWESDAFTLEPRDADVTLRVRSHTRSGRIFGYVLAGAGAGVAAVSLLTLGLETLADNAPTADGPRQHNDFGPGASIGLGVGLALAVLGGLIIFNTGPTQFSREAGTRAIE
jgi:hypothetical protein